MDSDGSIALWERLESMAGSALEMFTPGDVEAAMMAFPESLPRGTSPLWVGCLFSSAWSSPLFLESGTSLPSYRYYGIEAGSLRRPRIWDEIFCVRR